MIICESNYIIIHSEVNAFIFLITHFLISKSQSLFINMFISKFYWWLMGANPMGIGFPPIKMNL